MKENGNIFNIKSLFIIKKIFSLLKSNKKLEVLISNKKLQNIFELDIEGYIKASNRYKIAEKNGGGKEYLKDTNIIIFEGNYLNGKRYGPGKEYYSNGKIKFEGEYLNGNIINGFGFDIYGHKFIISEERKVKEYYDNGKLKFECEYYKGRKWNGIFYNSKGEKDFEIKYGRGIVKEYDLCSYLSFKGEYINGERNGKGKEFFGFNENVVYEGEYLNEKGMEKEKNLMHLMVN